MHDYQREFLDLSIAVGALRFGEFTLKSGRVSPYFFDSGRFTSGAALATLGACYADAIAASDVGFDMLFGPAYKGIPLAAITAAQLALRHGRDVPYAFDRKEAKAHGEGGRFVGSVSGRCLLVDDVVTAGTAARQSVELIADAGARAVALIISLDRQERGRTHRSAVQELSDELGLAVLRIATLTDLIDYLRERPGDADVDGMLRYRETYGVM